MEFILTYQQAKHTWRESFLKQARSTRCSTILLPVKPACSKRSASNA